MITDRPLVLAMAMLVVISGLTVITPVAASHGESGTVGVTTANATDVTESEALLGGELTHLNDSVESANLSFTYWTVGDRANETTVGADTLDEPDTFEAEVEGLDGNTTYAYRAIATANGTTVDGSTVQFTTATEPAEVELDVETESATNVSDSEATLNGNLTALDETAENTTAWFQYWIEGDRSTTERTERVRLDGTGTYATAVSNLSASETYTVRAHAETASSELNDTVDDQGAELAFTTGTGELGVETEDASDVTDSSATLNGRLAGLGAASNATVGFDYWVEGDAANATGVDAGVRSSVGAFSAGVSNLSNGTTYVYTATVSADNATIAGDNVTVTLGAADDGPTYSGQGPFGLWLNDVIETVENETDNSTPFGRIVSTIVRVSNPGNAPADAGPPEDRGPDGEERGPPEDVGPDDVNETENETDSDEAGPPEDVGPDDVNETENETDSDERGPPEDAGPDGDENETDSDERGPPEDVGSPEDIGPDGENETNGERGPPEDIGPDDGNETETESHDEGDSPEDIGPDDGNETENETDGDERGPPEDAGPSEDGPGAEDGGTEDEATDGDETEEREIEDEESDDGGSGGPSDGAGPGNGGGPP